MVADTQNSTAAPATATMPVKDQNLCRVVLLNGSSIDFSVDRRAKGQVLLNKVFSSLNLMEKDYFGLFYKNPQGDSKNLWLYPDKKISHQLRNAHGPYEFFFGVKFYPHDPTQLQEEITRHHLCLQVHQDIVAGKIPCSFVTYALLASYLVQSIFGDFESSETAEHHLESIKLAPEEQAGNKELRKKVEELYRSHKGQSPAEAEMNFLNTAKSLTLYGVELYPATDSNGEPVSIGVCSSGILIFKGGLRMNRFAWPKIIKIAWKKAFIVFTLRSGEFEVKQNTVSYRLHSYRDAKTCWRSAVEHHTFFRLMSPDTPAEAKKGGLFRLGSKRFKFIGRTQYQARLASSLVNRPSAAVIRSVSLHQHKQNGERGPDPRSVNGVPESTSAPDDVLKDVAPYIDEKSRSRDLSPEEKAFPPVQILPGATMEETYVVQEISPDMNAEKFAEVSPLGNIQEQYELGAEQPDVIHDMEYEGIPPHDYELETCVGLSPLYPWVHILNHSDIVAIPIPELDDVGKAGGSDDDGAALVSISFRPPAPPEHKESAEVQMKEATTVVTRQTPQSSPKCLVDESSVVGSWHESSPPSHTMTKEVISTITVSSSHGMVESTSYRKETDGVVESFSTEQTITGDTDLLEDDSLTQAIFKATQLSGNVMVEKLEEPSGPAAVENGQVDPNELA